MNDHNYNYRHLPPESRGLWKSWSRGRILGLTTLLMAGNFFFQILVYLAREDLFLPVLIGAVAGVLLPAFLIARRWNFDFRRDFGLTAPHPLVLAAAALLAVCSLLPTSLLAEFSLRLHPADPQWESFLREHLPTTTAGIIMAVVTVVAVAPLAEEIIFRGLLHRLTSSLWGAVPAALISSIVFGIVHGEPWFLFACWLAHAVHNSISLWAMLNHEGEFAEPQGITVQDWGLTVASIVGLLLVGKFLLTKGKARHRATDPGSLSGLEIRGF